MAKLVIEVKENKEPKQDDILVYNDTLECWEYKSKVDYLKGCHKDYLSLEKRLNQTNNRIDVLQEDIQRMAKIMKEGIK